MPEAKSGGGVLHARIGELPAEVVQDYYEIVQGEEKTLTFIVVAVGRFQLAEAETIICKFADYKNNVIAKTEDGSIQRVCQELDVQVLRCSLTADDTASLLPGLARVEISFDQQKAALHHSVKVIESL